MLQNDLIVQSGEIVALRLFDVAYEIDLKRAEELWARHAPGAGARARLSGTPAKAVSFGVPPLILALGAVELSLNNKPLAGSASIRLYDFGIAAITLRFPARKVAWSEFSRNVNAIDRMIGPSSDAVIWDGLLSRPRVVLSEALHRPTAAPLQEDYLIALVNAFNEPVTADALQDRIDLIPLLSGKDIPLSSSAQRDLLNQRFSYYPDDLAVITWDRAFLYEPRHDTDVADVIEIANAQLLEVRVYDEMLDKELPRMHDLVEAARKRANMLTSRRYARLARQLHTLVAEVSELAERVDNALQVTEDVYLARVYAAAIAMYRVPNISAAVDRKLSIIRETYTALHREAAGARAELLEMAVLILIAIEIVVSLLH